MIKSILVCTDGSTHSEIAADYGIHLATRLKARILGLHVLDLRMLEGPLLADISGWVGAQPYGFQVQQFRGLMEQKGDAVISAFNARCQAAGLKADSRVKMGHPPRVIVEEEARAELLVMGQKGEHADLIGDMTGSIVERVVRNSVKPCLITPSQFKPVTRILAAYDGSGHASKALQEAIELAQALSIPLVILTVLDAGNGGRAEDVSRDAAAIADSHGCAPEAVLLVPGSPASVILDVAYERHCDLIVLGAYGHSRIREMVIGSTTAHVLARARCSVMLVR